MVLEAVQMRRSKTHFEQVPVELVKEKIAEGLAEQEDKDKETGMDNVRRERPEQKTAPYNVSVGARRFAGELIHARERWLVLCEQAAIEQDSERLMQLVGEIDQLLREKQERLNLQPSKTQGAA
jgi:serine phosphatase RsbU (regulator of sigma subunit)